jgi:hypothetical protein
MPYVRKHLRGQRVFTDDAWGSYLIWASNAEQRVFLDGRIEFYDHTGVDEDYSSMEGRSSNTGFLLAKYGIQAALVARDDPIEAYFKSSSDWVRVYQDSTSVIFARTDIAGHGGGNYHPDKVR